MTAPPPAKRQRTNHVHPTQPLDTVRAQASAMANRSRHLGPRPDVEAKTDRVPRKYADVVQQGQRIVAACAMGPASWYKRRPRDEAPDWDALPITEDSPAAALLRLQSFMAAERDFEKLCAQRHLTNDKGVPGAPPQGFLRWVAVQRLLQLSPVGHADSDPLLPLKPIAKESNLLHTLQDVDVSVAVATDVQTHLATLVQTEAQGAVRRRKRLRPLEGSGEEKAAPADLPVQLVAPGGPFVDVACELPKYVRATGHHLPALQPAVARFRVERQRYLTLRTQYQTANRLVFDNLTGDERKKQEYLFRRRLWCVLMRYRTIRGIGYQMALPQAAFDALATGFGVTHECFASPLNHYMDSFCSAFPDVDRFFGARCSFFDFHPTEGSYEANPPFVEEIMAAMAIHMLRLLDAAQQKNKALSFFVVLPGWNDTPGFCRLAASPWLRRFQAYGKRSHCYRRGNQHELQNSMQVANARSFVLVLQTDAAATRWNAQGDTFDHFHAAFTAGAP